jgi:uncharacterized protein (TIGR02145 family)
MKNLNLFLSAVLMTAIMVIVCGGCGSNQEKSSTEVIGKQIWMTENLSVDKFRNGDPIPEAKTNEEWVKAGENKQPAWCYYDNDIAKGTKYGKLYNWYAVTDSRGLAPVGWHIPSDSEWTSLTGYLGGNSKAGKKMKSTSGWAGSGNGNNESGFFGLPGGFRFTNGTFLNVGKNGYWWSSTENDADTAWYRDLYYTNDYVFRFNYKKEDGFSVRCIKD